MQNLSLIFEILLSRQNPFVAIKDIAQENVKKMENRRLGQTTGKNFQGNIVKWLKGTNCVFIIGSF